MRLSANELRAAFAKIDSAQPFPPGFIDEGLVFHQPPRPGSYSPDDPYYQKYDLVDTIYRVCAVLGWMELYRRDPTFLSGPPDEKGRIEQCFRDIRAAFGDPFTDEKQHLTSHGEWLDGLILDDDQRAIGEKMLQKDGDSPAAVLGYAIFCEQLFRLPHPEDPVGNYVGSQNYWIWNATKFLLELRQPKAAPDFKRQRIKKVIAQLDNLSAVLQPH